MKYLKFVLILSFISVYSQNKKIDSLELVLNNHQKKDTIRVQILNEIASDLYQNNKEKAIKLGKESLKISDSLNYKLGKAESLYVLGKTQAAQYELKEAEKNINKSFLIFKNLNHKLGIAKCLNQIGVIFFFKNDNESALEYFYKALEKSKQIENNIVKANSYNNIGIIFNGKKKIKEALIHYNKALKVYKELNEFKKAAISLNNIGIAHLANKEYDKALKIYNECLEINTKLNNKHLIAHAYNNLAFIYDKKEKNHKSLSYYRKALKINKKIKNYTGICNSNNGISEIQIKLKNYKEALKHLEYSKTVAEKYSLLIYKLDIAELYYKLYYKKKEYKKSLFYFKEYKKHYDSIFSKESDNRFSNLETKYKIKEKELLAKKKEIKLKEKVEKTKDQLEKTKQQVLFASIIIILLFTAFSLIIYHSRIKRLSTEYQKVILEQKLLRSQMKPHFIFNSLSVLQGIVLHKEYKKAHKYISKFSRLLRKILESSREEIVNLETELNIINNYIFLRNMSGNSPYCTFKITVDKKINIKNTFIPPMIVQPIVENAFEHGFVDYDKTYNLLIDFKLENTNLICTITDNGKGLHNKITSKKPEKNSISSAIILERLHLFSIEYRKKYSLKIIDRKEFKKQGTKVILLLPHKIIKND